MTGTAPPSPQAGTAGEVVRAFVRLGLTSFGGPIAHLGYFRDELVLRRRWLGEREYAELVALCQFLPGPTSSQVGWMLGLLRAGPLGAVAAWTAFTLPSIMLLLAFAWGAAAFDSAFGGGVLHGLKVVAVAVVAQAVWGMARTLCPDRRRAAIALGTLLALSLWGGAAAQLVAIVVGALAGIWLCRDVASAKPATLAVPLSRRAGAALLAGFVALLVALPLLGGSAPVFAVADAFYRAGALVFGGGHVVLPLLEAQVVAPGWVDAETFLAGYGAAQAVPGPLFSFGAYLGAVLEPEPNGLAGAALCVVALFAPGLLLVTGVLPFWNAVRGQPLARAAVHGANAAVVGLLAAALYHPVWTGAVLAPVDFALAALGFVLLVRWQAPPWGVVLVLGLASGLMAVL